MTNQDFAYPTPRRDESSKEVLHGKEITDVYRWMEDPDSEETKKFVTEQNNVTFSYLKGCEEREAINKELTKLWDYPKIGVPFKRGSRYFFSKNSGLLNQSVLYVQDSLEGDARVFFDPNLLSEDGTVSLCQTSFSDDGAVMAYGLSTSGSDWFDVHFKKVETGENYPDVLEKIKFSALTWTIDNKGIFYSCYSDHETEASGRDTSSHSNQKLFYHRLGTKQSEDILCVEFPDEPKWRIEAEVTDCGRYLLVSPQKDCQDNLLFFSDLHALPGGVINGKLEITQIIFKFESDYEYVTNTGSKCVIRTNKNAPNYRLIVIDLNAPEEKNWTTLIPEHEKDVLEWTTCINRDKLITCHMSDVKNVLQVWDLDSGSLLTALPLDIGTVVGISGKKKDTEAFYKFSSMVVPGVIYRLNLAESPLTPQVFMETKIPGYDASEYEAKQVFYESHDGKKIPMFIASKKGAKRDGTTPCKLYGYGGFNISLSPSFSISNLFFVRHFGYMAIANIRGGGEYGESWHNQGRLFNKQNCFSDFIGAAEYLIENGYTCTSKLVIQGDSNGGLLVAACVNQRPDLFGAGIASVGVMDMLRFHKFTIGYSWCSDYGNPDEKAHFENVLKYSPLHNVKIPEGGKSYPAILLSTADHDDRVVPSHSLKFIAELQHVLGKVQKRDVPIMIRIETEAGHGGGIPTKKAIEEITDKLAFLVRALSYQFN